MSEINCSICCEDVAPHKTSFCLRCGFRFCTKCLNGMIESGRTVLCPQCRNNHIVSIGGVIAQPQEVDKKVLKMFSIVKDNIIELKNVIGLEKHISMVGINEFEFDLTRFDNDLTNSIIKSSEYVFNMIKKTSFKDVKTRDVIADSVVGATERNLKQFLAPLKNVYTAMTELNESIDNCFNYIKTNPHFQTVNNQYVNLYTFSKILNLEESTCFVLKHIFKTFSSSKIFNCENVNENIREMIYKSKLIPELDVKCSLEKTMHSANLFVEDMVKLI